MRLLILCNLILSSKIGNYKHNQSPFTWVELVAPTTNWPCGRHWLHPRRIWVLGINIQCPFPIVCDREGERGEERGGKEIGISVLLCLRWFYPALKVTRIPCFSKKAVSPQSWNLARTVVHAYGGFYVWRHCSPERWLWECITSSVSLVLLQSSYVGYKYITVEYILKILSDVGYIHVPTWNFNLICPKLNNY